MQAAIIKKKLLTFYSIKTKYKSNQVARIRGRMDQDQTSLVEKPGAEPPGQSIKYPQTAPQPLKTDNHTNEKNDSPAA